MSFVPVSTTPPMFHTHVSLINHWHYSPSNFVVWPLTTQHDINATQWCYLLCST